MQMAEARDLSGRGRGSLYDSKPHHTIWQRYALAATQGISHIFSAQDGLS